MDVPIGTPTMKTLAVRLPAAADRQEIKRWRLISTSVAAVASIVAGAGQVVLSGAMFTLAHSLTLWFLVGLLAALIGNIKQAAITATATLAISVVLFFLAWSVADPQLVGIFNPRLVILWIFAAPVAGVLLALIAAALRGSPLASGAATGVVAGFLLGDVAITLYSSNVIIGWTYAFGHVDALVVLAAAAIMVILSWELRRIGRMEGRRKSAIVGLVPGAVAGYFTAFAPVLFHSVVDHLRFLW